MNFLNHKKKYKKRSIRTKGFALLMSVLISSIIMSIALVMFNIGLKQITLSTFGRDSQVALFSADTGVECALYWDLHGNGIVSQFATTTSGGSINCIGKTITTGSQISGGSQCSNTNSGTGITNNSACLQTSTIGGNGASTVFQLNYPYETSASYILKPCAIVTVSKTWDFVKNRVNTSIITDGFNTCDTTNPLRVDRELEVDY